MSSNPVLPSEFAALAPDFAVPDPLDAPGLRWGILGPGGIAHTFAQAIGQTASRVTAVGSRSQERAQVFADLYQVPHAFGSYQALVDSDTVDAIYIATPHTLHRDNALLALRAGKPVLVEKPFTMTAEEAADVFDEASSLGLFAMEAMWSRHLPHYRWISSVIEAGKGGRLVSVQADHGQSLRHVPRVVTAALGGGAVLDLGIYSLHFAHHALGKPDRICALGTGAGDPGVDATMAILGRYPSGAISVASCTLDGRNATAGALTFERLSIELPDQFYRPTVVRLRTFDEQGTETVAEWDARVTGGFQYQIAEAARCITGGIQQSPRVPWQATLDVMEVIDQARAQID